MSQTYVVIVAPGAEPERLTMEGPPEAYRKRAGDPLQIVPWSAPFIVYADLVEDGPLNRVVEGRPVRGTMVVLADAGNGKDRGLTEEEAERVIELVRGIPCEPPEAARGSHPAERERLPALPHEGEKAGAPSAKVTVVLAHPDADPRDLEVEASDETYKALLGAPPGQVLWDAPYLLYTGVGVKEQASFHGEPTLHREPLLNRIVPAGETRYAVAGPMLILGDTGDGQTPRGLSAGEVEEVKRLVREMPRFPVWIFVHPPS